MDIANPSVALEDGSGAVALRALVHRFAFF